MHSSAEKGFAKLGKLIEEEKLPDSAMPRLFYMGHKCLCSYAGSVRQYKCIKCEHEWSVDRENISEEQKKQKQCPNCKEFEPDGDWDEIIFEITRERRARWQCLDCKHEWDSEDGTTCPSCKSHKEN